MRSVSFLCLLLVCTLAQAEAPPIQQWIDEAIQAGGGVVTIPEGEHVLDKGLVIKDANKLALRGVDKERCILKLAATDDESALIQITGTCETLEIASLTLDSGSGKPQELVLMTGLPEKYQVPAKPAAPTASIQDVTLRDCLLQNFPGSAISVKHAAAVAIERCSFRDGTGAAMKWESAQASVARGNQIIRVATAFNLHSSHACLLEGNEVRDSQEAISITSSSPQPEDARHTLRNNGFFKVAEGLDLSSVQPAPLCENNDPLVTP
ncbi:right-handed parallel beta-helix repeat-containing protein [Prosthecobacter sp. SYSU 5D2]|uniref:right-handed parallel beta-helix repeat-containing protein n=1 Tax=Prosthecobacter sp. SYSU 5D2 TaxID=3134134 RepID=UPI0031FF2187